MGDNRINTTPAPTPLPPRRTDSLAPQPTPVPAATPATPAARDTSKTGPLDPSLVPQDVNIDHIDVPKPPEHHGLWDSIKGAASAVVHKVEDVAHTVEHAAVDVLHTAEHVVEVGEHIVAAGVHGFADGRHHGEGVLQALGDGLHAAGDTAYKEAADPLLTHAIGAADKADDKAAGALGPLLTNRLAVGDSVDIKIEAGATLPTEIVGAPNVKLDGGGTLKIKRVAAVDENNKPIMNPDGTQQTRLEVELKAEGRVGGAYSAKIGAGAKVTAAGHELSAKAEAEAKAEAGLTGSLSLKLRFNPDDPKEMGDLLAMTKATASTGAAATIPGLGLLIAGMDHKDYERSMNTLGSHLEEMSGEGGLYAQANASASVGVGIFKSKPGAANGLTGKTEKPEFNWTPEEKAEHEAKGETTDPKTGLLAKGLDAGHDAVLDKLKLQLGQAGVGVGGDVKVGMKKNFRTGETTYTLQVNGQANIQGNVLGAGAEAGAAGNRTINLVMGKDGQLKDITVQQSMTKEKFQGVMTTVADVYGRPIDEGMIAGLKSSDTIQLNYHIKPALVAQMRDAKDLGALGQAAIAVSGAAITKDRFQLDPGDIVATHRDELDFRFDVGAALGAEIDIRGGVVLGHNQERTVG
ncbi:MAG: hypothetical protein JWM80_4063 [Cyanobacteria bacterium RYN_339]|nr:hypothetical protein [Cyanobacteria bacterium RYN_339]